MKTLNVMASTPVLSTLFYSCNKNEYAPKVADQEFSLKENSPAGTNMGVLKEQNIN